MHLGLGDPVDLWAGLEPRFPASGSPWRVPPGKPLRTEVPEIPSDPIEWGLPRLSLHESVADLLSHIFDYSVSPMVGLDGPLSITAGDLIERRSLAELEARLEMDLTMRPAPAYLLVQLTGSRGTSYYTPEWQGLNRKTRIIEWLTSEGRGAMARLRLRGIRHEGTEFRGDVTARQARRYIDYFREMGTHVVRSISYGERLFQVHAANAELLPILREMLARQPDGVAQGMAHLTRTPWVTGASPILSASESAEAQRVARHEIWASDVPGEPPSLLSPRAIPAQGRAAVLGTLPADAIIGVSFACQALYMEDHRADAWSRLMRAGICQRFPAARASGWRLREQVPLADFLASAALSGEEALCKPAAPDLPAIALMLDVTAPARIAKASPHCLSLFAATNPGTGKAAELEIDAADFDPARLEIPFLDGALCVTDRKGERSCLVESVWLGRGKGDAPAIVGAPAEPDFATLTRHAAQLEAYLGLMGQLQGAGFPPEVALAMRRGAAWLAEVAADHPPLLPLRWQALQVVRCAVPVEPATMGHDPASRDGLARLLASGMDLLALPAESPQLGVAAEHADRQLRALYAGLPAMLEAGELEARSLSAAEALQQRLARLADTPDLPEPAAAVLAAGADLSQPPDPRRMPHVAIPGGDPYAMLWNAVLALRARYTECRAILLATQGRIAEAVDLLAREIVGSREAVQDPALDLLTALDALLGMPSRIDASDRDMLQMEAAELGMLHGAARLLQSARVSRGAAETGPQLHRLLLLLEMIHLSRAAGIPLPALDSLAPAALAGQIDQALIAAAGDRRPA